MSELTTNLEINTPEEGKQLLAEVESYTRRCEVFYEIRQHSEQLFTDFFNNNLLVRICWVYIVPGT